MSVLLCFMEAIKAQKFWTLIDQAGISKEQEMHKEK